MLMLWNCQGEWQKCVMGRVKEERGVWGVGCVCVCVCACVCVCEGGGGPAKGYTYTHHY